jgi:hypothetical protein
MLPCIRIVCRYTTSGPSSREHPFDVLALLWKSDPLSRNGSLLRFHDPGHQLSCHNTKTLLNNRFSWVCTRKLQLYVNQKIHRPSFETRYPECTSDWANAASFHAHHLDVSGLYFLVSHSRPRHCTVYTNSVTFQQKQAEESVFLQHYNCLFTLKSIQIFTCVEQTKFFF